MKHFKNKSDLINAYLSNNYTHGKTSNLFFEWNRIYSYGYHYLLAEKHKNVILVHCVNYSNSTSKQKSKLLIQINTPYIFVPRPEGMHTENKAYLKSQIDKFEQMQKRARKYDYTSEILSAKEDLLNYVKFFNL